VVRKNERDGNGGRCYGATYKKVKKEKKKKKRYKTMEVICREISGKIIHRPTTLSEGA